MTTVMAIKAFNADDPGTNKAALRYNIVRQSPDNRPPECSTLMQKMVISSLPSPLRCLTER